MKNLLSWLYLLLGLLVVGVIYFILKKVLSLINPSGTAAWWGSLFGLAKPGTKIPDLTGTVGEDISQASQATATAAAAPQISYDLARSKYMKNRGLSAAWDDPKAAGWPWDSFDQWYAAGMSPLPI